MRYGIKTAPEHTTWAELRDVWVAADDIEVFESAWNWDHFYPLTGDTSGPNLEGWTMLGALGQATRRLRIGCQVTGMVYRHPAVLANMAATVDIICAGRLELGLGAGWNEEETTAYGMSLRDRFDRFDEGLEVIVGLLTQPTTTLTGRYFQLTEARCEPKPVQRPHPPITIGGRGRRRTLRAAARWAQQWNAIPSTADEWVELKGVLAEHCAAIGRDPGEITCSTNVRMQADADVNKSIALVVEKIGTYRDAGVDLMIVNLPRRAKPGILEPLAEALTSIG